MVYCHPDPESFTAAVRDAAVTAMRSAGHDVRVRDLYADGFDPVLDASELAAYGQPAESDANTAHVEELLWCEHLVLVYPTWWSGQPARLKGWIDRVWVRGVAWDLPPWVNRAQGRLHNVRHITVVTSHGSSKFVNVLEGEAGKRTVQRSLRPVCHPSARMTWLALYGFDRRGQSARDRFLSRVASHFNRGPGSGDATTRT